ncbi:hypothetical protein Tco_0049984, partial [Tanacetum coccineum]
CSFDSIKVQFHLFKYGIDLSYTKWDKHGEKDKQATTAQIPINATTEFVDDTDFDMDFGSEIPTYGPSTVEMVNATKESFDEDDLANVNPPRSEEGSLQLAELMDLCTSLQRKVDALEKDKLAQATEILSLKKRVEKLEKRRKSKPSVLRTLKKIGSATRVESSEEASLGAEENASKQGEVVVKPAETGVSAALDVEVSAAEPAVTTVSSLVTTDSVTITATELVSAAAKELTDNDMTMAEALAELKTSKPKLVTSVPILNSGTTVTTTKPKAKGITIQEPLVTQK